MVGILDKAKEARKATDDRLRKLLNAPTAEDQARAERIEKQAKEGFPPSDEDRAFKDQYDKGPKDPTLYNAIKTGQNLFLIGGAVGKTLLVVGVGLAALVVAGYLHLNNAAIDRSERPVEADAISADSRAESRVRGQAERLAEGHCALSRESRESRADFNSATRRVEYSVNSVTVTSIYTDNQGERKETTLTRRC